MRSLIQHFPQHHQLRSVEVEKRYFFIPYPSHYDLALTSPRNSVCRQLLWMTQLLGPAIPKVMLPNILLLRHSSPRHSQPRSARTTSPPRPSNLSPILFTHAPSTRTSITQPSPSMNVYIVAQQAVQMFHPPLHHFTLCMFLLISPCTFGPNLSIALLGFIHLATPMSTHILNTKTTWSLIKLSILPTIRPLMHLPILPIICPLIHLSILKIILFKVFIQNNRFTLLLDHKFSPLACLLIVQLMIIT